MAAWEMGNCSFLCVFLEFLFFFLRQDLVMLPRLVLNYWLSSLSLWVLGLQGYTTRHSFWVLFTRSYQHRTKGNCVNLVPSMQYEKQLQNQVSLGNTGFSYLFFRVLVYISTLKVFKVHNKGTCLLGVLFDLRAYFCTKPTQHPHFRTFCSFGFIFTFLPEEEIISYSIFVCQTMCYIASSMHSIKTYGSKMKLA
jgi:hypothetical protein